MCLLLSPDPLPACCPSHLTRCLPVCCMWVCVKVRPTAPPAFPANIKIADTRSNMLRKAAATAARKHGQYDLKAERWVWGVRSRA